MAQMATSSTDAVDAVLEKLLSVRGERPGKQVALEDNEIRMLCIRAREVFMAQPILLELEAPIKICGDLCGNQPKCRVRSMAWRTTRRFSRTRRKILISTQVAMSTGSTMIY